MPYPNASPGLRRLFDAQMAYHRSANPVYLRVKNFQSQQAQLYDQLGFQIAPLAGTTPTGTTDVLIQPRPASQKADMSTIANSMGKLRLGARVFFVSATWVWRFAQSNNIADPYLVFEESRTVGLIMNGRVWQVVMIEETNGLGGTLYYTITANAPEPLGV